MRLLMTTDTVGGVWTFTKELAGGLLDRGCEVVLVSFGGSSSPDQQRTVDELRERGHIRYILSELPLEWMPANENAYTSGEPLLLRLCHEFQPDALLLSQFCFGALPVDTPKILIAHSDVLSWAVAVGKAPLAEDAWLQNYRALVQHGLDGADMLVAPTKATLDAMRLHFRLPGRTLVLPNGRTIQDDAALCSKQLRVVSAGRMWDPAKNLALLTSTQSPMPILVVGANDAQHSPSGDLLVLSTKNESELLALFGESAIYVCPSTYEPFGLAPLEAALCGCAIVANDIPSLREVWGDAALYFCDAETLSFVLEALAQDAALLTQVQVRSTRRAHIYTAERMTRDYLLQLEALITTTVENQTRAA